MGHVPHLGCRSPQLGLDGSWKLVLHEFLGRWPETGQPLLGHLEDVKAVRINRLPGKLALELGQTGWNPGSSQGAPGSSRCSWRSPLRSQDGSLQSPLPSLSARAARSTRATRGTPLAAAALRPGPAVALRAPRLACADSRHGRRRREEGEGEFVSCLGLFRFVSFVLLIYLYVVLVLFVFLGGGCVKLAACREHGANAQQ